VNLGRIDARIELDADLVLQPRGILPVFAETYRSGLRSGDQILARGILDGGDLQRDGAEVVRQPRYGGA